MNILGTILLILLDMWFGWYSLLIALDSIACVLELQEADENVDIIYYISGIFFMFLFLLDIAFAVIFSLSLFKR